MNLADMLAEQRRIEGRTWRSIEQEYKVSDRAFARLINGEYNVPRGKTLAAAARFLRCSQIEVILAAYEGMGIYDPKTDGVLKRPEHDLPEDVRLAITRLEDVLVARLD